jgi:hypothetical protein
VRLRHEAARRILLHQVVQTADAFFLQHRVALGLAGHQRRAAEVVVHLVDALVGGVLAQDLAVVPEGDLVVLLRLLGLVGAALLLEALHRLVVGHSLELVLILRLFPVSLGQPEQHVGLVLVGPVGVDDRLERRDLLLSDVAHPSLDRHRLLVEQRRLVLLQAEGALASEGLGVAFRRRRRSGVSRLGDLSGRRQGEEAGCEHRDAGDVPSPTAHGNPISWGATTWRRAGDSE